MIRDDYYRGEDWIRILIPGDPASGNMATRTANGRQYKPTAAAGYEASVYGHAFAEADRVRWQMPEYVAVHVHIFNSRKDADNAVKVLLDGLQGVLYAHDSRVRELLIMRFRDKEKPRVVVHARPLDAIEMKNLGLTKPRAPKVLSRARAHTPQPTSRAVSRR